MDISNYSTKFLTWMVNLTTDYWLDVDIIRPKNQSKIIIDYIYDVCPVYLRDIIHQAIDNINTLYGEEIGLWINDLNGNYIQIINNDGIYVRLFSYRKHDSIIECRLKSLEWIWERSK